MPARNVVKEDILESYYHIYARGVNRSSIFNHDKDYVVFMSLLKRYLSTEVATNENGIVYPHLYGQVELLAFCLLSNHFHLLIYQQEEGAMQQLMRAVMTSYSMYFNKTYRRSGPLFESRYRASHIDSDRYLTHISRYIHLNPDKWQTYKYSSIPFYTDNYSAEWLRPEKIFGLFSSKYEYLEFLADYEDYKATLEDTKRELANN